MSKREQLYDNLIKSGKVSTNEIGTKEQFVDALSSEDAIREFHKNLSSVFSAGEIGSADDFYGSVRSDLDEEYARSLGIGEETIKKAKEWLGGTTAQQTQPTAKKQTFDDVLTEAKDYDMTATKDAPKDGVLTTYVPGEIIGQQEQRPLYESRNVIGEQLQKDSAPKYSGKSFEEIWREAGGVEAEKANATTTPQVPQEYADTFGEGIAEGSKALGYGMENLAAEGLRLVTGSQSDYDMAIDMLSHLRKMGINPNELDADEIIDMYNQSAEHYIEEREANKEGRTKYPDGVDRRSMLDQIDESVNLFSPTKAKKIKASRRLAQALKDANGDMDKAKDLLIIRSVDKNEETVADRWSNEAREGLRNVKETKGFGAWVGNLLPQMAGNALALTAAVVTKKPQIARAIGLGNTAMLTASTAGSSMATARDYADTHTGVSEGDIWRAGIVDGGIEYLTEKIPLDMYLGNVLNKATKQTGLRIAGDIGKEATDAELDKLLKSARSQFGGRLLTANTIKQYLAQVGTEGASEFMAGVLQTLSPMIYQNPEDYPTLLQALEDGWEGAKAGFFMGAFLGGGSTVIANRQQRARRKAQGRVYLADAGDQGIVEIVGENEDGTYLILDTKGKESSISKDALNDITTIAFESFDKGRVVNDGAVAKAQGTQAETPQEVRRVGKSLSEAQSAIIGIDSGESIKSAIDSYIADGAEDISQVSAVLDGLSESDREVAEDYFLARTRMQSYADKVQEIIDDAVSQEEERLAPYIYGGDSELEYDANGDIVRDEDGNAVDRTTPRIFAEAVITPVNAHLKDEEPYSVMLTNYYPDSPFVTYVDANGVPQMVKRDDANIEVVEHDYDEYMAEYRAKIEADADARADMMLEHNEQTNRVMNIGETIETLNGQMTVLNNDGQGNVTLAPVQLNSKGETEVVRGSQPVTMSAREAMALQDEYYERPTEVADNSQSAEVVDNMSANQAQNEGISNGENEQNVSKPTAEPIPTVQNGKKSRVAYEQVPVARTIEEVYGQFDDQAEVDEFIDLNIAEAETAVKNASKPKPKMSTDIEAYKQAKAKWQEEQAGLAEAQKRLDYWKEVKAESERMQGLDTATEIPQDTKKDDNAPRSAMEYVASMIGRLDPESYRKETGYGVKEQRKAGPIFLKKENGGMTVEGLAEWICEQPEAQEWGIQPGMDSEVRDMIIEVLSHGSPKAYIRDAHAQQAKADAYGEEQYLENMAAAQGFASADDMIAHDEVFLAEAIRRNYGLDENEYYANLAEEYEQEDNRRYGQGNERQDNGTSAERPGQGDTTAEVADVSGSSEVLSEEQSADTTGTESGNEQGELSRSTEGGNESIAENEVVRGESVEQEPSVAPEQQAVVERVGQWEQQLGVKVNVITDASEVENETVREQLREKKEGDSVKGWFDPKTGEAYVYLPDNHSVEDVDETIIHEVIAHKGLRGLLGRAKFNKLCDAVWGSMSAKDKARFLSYVDGKVGNVRDQRAAADEYIAHLAEKMDKAELTKAEKGIWQTIVDYIMDALEKVGIKVTDKQIEALIKASYANMVSKASQDTDTKDLLEYAQRDVERRAIEGRTMFSKRLKEVNDKFNKTLATYKEENADKIVFDLGLPSDILLSAGVANKRMKLYGSKVKRKIAKHKFSASDMQDLPMHVAYPIAVFDNYNEEYNRSILTELRTEQGNFLVTLSIGRGQDIDFNIISSVFGKGDDNVVNWLNKGYATYIDKTKALNYLHLVTPIVTASNNQELDSATKVIEEFENPKLSEENEETRFKKYKSKDGKETAYRQLSLFDTEGEATNDRPRPVSVQRKGDSRLTTLNNLRELEEGEVCNVERRFSEKGGFDFTRGEKVLFVEDVAYIFKNLEDEAIENSFVAFVKGDEVTVMHVGMGAQTMTVTDQTAVIAGAERLNADKVFFVHNHPSGKLVCSREDINLYTSLKMALGDKLWDGIIINTRSGKYGVFNENGIVSSGEEHISPQKEYPLKIYGFNKQAFHGDVVNIEPSSSGIAKFVSTQRLGSRNKINALLLNNSFGCLGNVFLSETDITEKNAYPVMQKLVADAISMGARSIVLYGRAPFVYFTGGKLNLGSRLSEYVKMLSSGQIQLQDVIQLGEGSYTSAIDDGIRFRKANRNQVGFVSNAMVAVEGVKQEKATPEQWLKMIEKHGGLKAGEDKWLGLSDWLKSLSPNPSPNGEGNSKPRVVTKDEVLEFIGENMIQIEEVTYGEGMPKHAQEKLDELNEEFQALIWEGDEETGSVYTSDWVDYAWSAMVDRYGDDIDGAFEIEGNGTNAELVPMLDYDDEMVDQAKYFLEINDYTSRPINSTRLDYTTEGLENKREIALTVPTIESWNESDEIHFGDAGDGRAVAWIRFGETTDADGSKVLVIDEIQSKRHQEGREKGYKDAKLERIDSRLNALSRSSEAEIEEATRLSSERYSYIVNKLGHDAIAMDEELTALMQRNKELVEEKKNEENERLEIIKLNDELDKVRNVRDYDRIDAEIKSIENRIEQRENERKEILERIEEIDSRLNKLINDYVREQRYGVSSAPFEKNWHELAMKRMLRLAAEEGFDKVAWTTGGQQAERYNIGDSVERITSEEYGMDEEGNRTTLVDIEPHGEMNNFRFEVNSEGIIIDGDREYEGKPLSDIVGKEIASKLMQGPTTISGQGLHIGGEGMKGFYDKMLPSFVQKYTKKWGAKVGEVTLPNLEESAQKMWSVDVTPQMKESVEEQVMFSKKPAEIEAEKAKHSRPVRETNDTNDLLEYAKRDVERREGTRFSKRTTAKEGFDAYTKDFKTDGINITLLYSPEDYYRYAIDVLGANEEEADEFVELVKENKIGGLFLSGTNEIALFADNIDNAYSVLFHEHTHLAVEKLGDINRFAELASELSVIDEELADRIGQRYRSEDIEKEVIAYSLQYALEGGAMSELRAVLSDNSKALLDNLLNYIGYDTGKDYKKEVERQEKREGSNLVKRQQRTRNQVRRFSGLRGSLLEEGSIPQGLVEESAKKEGGLKGFDALAYAQQKVKEREDEVRMRKRKAMVRIKDKETEDQKRYNDETSGWFANLLEAWVDFLRPVRKLQESIEKTFGKLADYQNPYLLALTASSRNKIEEELLKVNLIEPMDKFLRGLIRKNNVSYDEIDRYLNAKHGLERNVKLAERDAKNLATDEDGNVDQAVYLNELQNNRKKDYSGLTDLFRTETEKEDGTKVSVAELERRANEYIKSFEDRMGQENTEKLWAHVKALNAFALQKSYSSNMLSKDEFDELANMYEYYVPLRGFAEKTAGDIWNYLSDNTYGVVNPVKKTAEGRTSRADSIVATLYNMAESAIVQGNKNKTALALLNLAEQSPSSLLSVSRMWYVKNPDTKKWEVSVPDLENCDTQEKVTEAIQKHEEEMRAKEVLGLAKRKKGKLEIQYKALPYHVAEHGVRVKRGGQEYIVYVNGNPKAAQALNGLLNEDVWHASKKNLDKFTKYVKWIFRWKAKTYTSLNPEFIITNFQRDLQSAFTIMAVRHGQKFAFDLTKHVFENVPLTSVIGKENKGRAKAVGIYTLYKKFFEGTLDMNNKRERYFHEFMMNGGETGYTQLDSVEDFKKKLENLDENIAKHGAKAAIKAVGDFIEFANRGIENAVRFAAFQTAREHGMSLLNSINEAKEASVNFNRKGSGALLNATARDSYMFINPAIQSTYQYAKLMKDYGWRGVGAFGVWSGLGVAIPLINIYVASMWAGDDDDETTMEDMYMALSPYKRRNFINIYIGNQTYYSVNLPVEQRVPYGLACIAMEMLTGQIDAEQGAWDMAGQVFNNILPRDIYNDNLGNARYSKGMSDFIEGVAKGLTPDLIADIAGPLVWNEDFLGRPITGVNKYNDYLPEWQRIGNNTPEWVRDMAKSVAKFDGNEYDKDWYDSQYLNPGGWYHIITQNVPLLPIISKGYKTYAAMAREDDVDEVVKNIPFGSRFLTTVNKDYAENRAMRYEFELLMSDIDDVDQQNKAINADKSISVMEAAELKEALKNTPEGIAHDVWTKRPKKGKSLRTRYDNIYDEYREARNNNDVKRKRELQAELDEIRKDAIERINKKVNETYGE